MFEKKRTDDIWVYNNGKVLRFGLAFNKYVQ